MGNRAENRVGFAGKLITAGRIALGAAAPVAVIGIAEACGGGNDSPSNTGQRTEAPGTLPSQTGLTESPSGQSPLGGATPVITETPTIAPTPEITPFQAKKLAEAKFAPTSFKTLTENFNKAFAAHPEAGNVIDEGGNQLNRERFEINLNNCENGDEITRVNQCSSLIGISLTIYGQTQYEDFYQLAVDAANYFLTEIPSRQAELDSTLQAFYHTSSPSTK